MSTVSLSRKWRPQRFAEVVGQEHVVRTLQNALRTGRVHHAYLFSGPRGVGKTTLARLFAKALNCEAEAPDAEPCNQCTSCRQIQAGRSLDVVEIDAASNNSVEDIRQLRENVRLGTTGSRYRVYIIDEAHMLSNAAWNALLKTLEEPPPHVIFIFASTEKNRFPATILSRCQQFEFHRMSYAQVVERLQELATAEGFSVDPEGLALIAQQSEGCLRDAQSLLEQLMAFSPEGAATVEAVSRMLGLGSERTLVELIQAILDGEATEALRRSHALITQGADLFVTLRRLMAHFHALLRLRLDPQFAETVEAPPNRVQEMQAQAERLSLERIQWILKVLMQAESEMRLYGFPLYSFELALVEACQAPEAIPIEEALERLEALQERWEQPSVPTAESTAPTLRAPAPEPTVGEPQPQAAPPPKEEGSGPPSQSEPSAALPFDSVEAIQNALLPILRKRNPVLASELEAAEWEIQDDRLIFWFRRRTSMRLVASRQQALDEVLRTAFGGPIPYRLALRERTQRSLPPTAPQPESADDPQERAVQETLQLFDGEIDLDNPPQWLGPR